MGQGVGKKGMMPQILDPKIARSCPLIVSIGLVLFYFSSVAKKNINYKENELDR